MKYDREFKEQALKLSDEIGVKKAAEIIKQKYSMGVPLYRQEQQFRQMQINLTRQTMANWIIAASKLIKPIYEYMHDQLKEAEIIHADETTLEVLTEPDREPQAKSYMWVYTTGKSEDKKIILYDYRQGRSGRYAKEYLKVLRVGLFHMP